MYRSERHPTADPLARGLGWFSIALGVAELVAPKEIARALGMEDRSGLIQAYGVREVATGLAILGSSDPAPSIWGRVAGDALDLATIAPSLEESNPQRDNAMWAFVAVAGVTLVDLACATALSRRAEDGVPIRDYSDRSGFPKGRPRLPARAAVTDESEAHPS